MLHTTSDQKLSGNPIDDVIGSSIKYAAIVSAAKLGVMKALNEQHLTIDELASRLEVSARGLQALVDVLATLGYVEVADGKYGPGEIARRWLSPDEKLDFTPALLWGYELWNVLWDLPDAIRHGKPQRSLWQRWENNPRAGADFSDYMKVKSRLTLASIVEALPMPREARRLIDLGGSHGLHAMALCSRYPNLHATVMDLPEALANTKRAVADARLEQRVTLKPGDFLKDDMGRGYDAVLLFEIVHNHTPDENRELIARASRALNPGGIVAVLEDVKEHALDEHNAAFSLAMFACSGDRTYARDEIAAWLKGAELSRIEQVKLPSSVSLMIGHKA